MIINIWECFTFRKSDFIRRWTSARCKGARRWKAPWQQQTEKLLSRKCMKVRREWRSASKQDSASSSISPFANASNSNRIIWKCFRFFRPFPTDKNKKQKSDILNFLVVCFTICFFFLYFSLQLSHIWGFAVILFYFFFAFLASSANFSVIWVLLFFCV